MEFFNPRKLKFKAWNTETKLLMRLNSIDNIRGELIKKEHILLQFTGLYDQDGEELYDMDVLLKGSEKFIIYWNDNASGWSIALLDNPMQTLSNLKETALLGRKLGNYFELRRDK
ncbi:MAG TPA: YopX family protein [Cyclobacteriaceae bacterium]|jgi:hypothetical protein|nr:YopX family protein [Cyclobacteriaceae bacterium]